jgi:hypothetical protein
VFEETRRAFVARQQSIKEAEIHRLDDELHRKVSPLQFLLLAYTLKQAQLREIETQSALADAESRALQVSNCVIVFSSYLYSAGRPARDVPSAA